MVGLYGQFSTNTGGMVMRFFTMLALALVAITGLQAPARAEVITVTSSGTFGTMQNGPLPLLVPPGTRFSLRFTYDSAAVGTVINSVVTRYSSIATARMRIGSVTYAAPVTLEAINVNGSGLLVALFDFGRPMPGVQRGMTWLSEFAPGAINGTALPSDRGFFSRYRFSAQAYDYLDPATDPDSDPTLAISFSDGLVRTAAVPEPGTWMMMILGFGMIGGMVRRRKGALRPALA
jgi:PEP-CTERM motif